MIETPSLRTRVMVVTVGVIVALVLALDLVVWFSLRDRLDDTLFEVLDARVALVGRLAEEVDGGAELAAELDALGVPARLTAPGGDVPEDIDARDPREQQVLRLDDGTLVEVFVSRAGADATLSRVLVVELAGSLAAIALALVLLTRGATVITRPLERMVATAHEIAEGDLSRRLSPSDPDTELGRMAAAFDQMIDALEQAVSEAREAEVRSRRFLADAAHQLRTPLAGLRASAETLLAHPDGPDRDRMAANVARESARLSRRVAALLRVARLDRGRATGPSARPFSPGSSPTRSSGSVPWPRSWRSGSRRPAPCRPWRATPMRFARPWRTCSTTAVGSPGRRSPWSRRGAWDWWSWSSGTTGPASRRTSVVVSSTGSSPPTRDPGWACRSLAPSPSPTGVTSRWRTTRSC